MEKIKIFIISFCFISILATPSAIFAIGQVTAPIIVNDALRGESFQKTMTIVNTEQKEIDVDIFAEGDIKEWVKFYKKDDFENDIDNIKMSDMERLKIIAEFSIPTDIANGEYAGSLSIIRKPDESSVEEGESSASILQKLSRKVAITVSDNEIIKFTASVIPSKYNLKKDEPLSIRFIYDNQGNISLSPQIHLRITQNGKAVHNAIYPYPEDESPVTPLSLQEIPKLTIQTIGYEKGSYNAEIKILNNNETLFKKSFHFSVGSTVKGVSVASFSNITKNNLDKIFGTMAMVAVLIILISVKRNLRVKAYKTVDKK